MNNIENLLACLPGGIERQEAAGQVKLVASEWLPKKLNGVTREQLTAIGFKFGNDVDDLFVECELPPGWTKRATDHAMHSDILDEKGRKRAGIFYKAAFYDRSAHMYMCHRFSINPYKKVSWSSEHLQCVVEDGGKAVFIAGDCHQRAYSRLEEMTDQATAWLNIHYPNWKNQLAYWEDTPC